jgi:hypothetical protein
MKTLIAILVFLKVAKTDGEKDSSGTYMTYGINKWNPLSYIVFLVVLPLSIIIGIANSILDTYETMFNW